MGSTVISKALHANTSAASGVDAGAKPSPRAIRRRRRTRVPAAGLDPVVHPAKRGLGSSSEKDRLLEHARVLLDPLSSLEMLCEADEKMENAIFYMNRAATETMTVNHKRLNPSLRGADVRNALGHSIHQYHKDPERIRNVFRALVADPIHSSPSVEAGLARASASARTFIAVSSL
jgi:hypothetical protein